MPSATFSHTVYIEQHTHAAWAALQKPETWSDIGPVSEVMNPSFNDDDTLRSFDWIADLGGKKYPGTAWTTAYTIPESFSLTMDTSEISGDVVATIGTSERGTSIKVEITFKTKGMLSAMFFPAIRQALSSGFPKQIEDLAAAI